MYIIYCIGDQNVIHKRFHLEHLCIVPVFFFVKILHHLIKQNDEGSDQRVSYSQHFFIPTIVYMIPADLYLYSA